jgi:ABC-type Zn uptake system ZnuABC Zn-binding protein ZnuA
VAELVATMEDAGVSVIFTDIGTPQSVAEAVAAETGADVVLVNDAQLPPDGSYLTLMRELAHAIAGALASQ